MAMGEAAGLAAALALQSGVDVANIDVAVLQKRLRAVGGSRRSAPLTDAGRRGGVA